jgi:hypothetical protein
MPEKKADKLAHYYQICNQGDPLVPELQLLPPLPPPPAPIDSSNEDTQTAIDVSLFDDNESTASKEGDNELLMRIDALLITEV